MLKTMFGLFFPSQGFISFNWKILKDMQKIRTSNIDWSLQSFHLSFNWWLYRWREELPFKIVLPVPKSNWKPSLIYSNITGRSFWNKILKPIGRILWDGWRRKRCKNILEQWRIVIGADTGQFFMCSWNLFQKYFTPSISRVLSQIKLEIGFLQLDGQQLKLVWTPWIKRIYIYHTLKTI